MEENIFSLTEQVAELNSIDQQKDLQIIELKHKVCFFSIFSGGELKF